MSDIRKLEALLKELGQEIPDEFTLSDLEEDIEATFHFLTRAMHEIGFLIEDQLENHTNTPKTVNELINDYIKNNPEKESIIESYKEYILESPRFSKLLEGNTDNFLSQLEEFDKLEPRVYAYFSVACDIAYTKNEEETLNFDILEQLIATDKERSSKHSDTIYTELRTLAFFFTTIKDFTSEEIVFDEHYSIKKNNLSISEKNKNKELNELLTDFIDRLPENLQETPIKDLKSRLSKLNKIHKENTKREIERLPKEIQSLISVEEFIKNKETYLLDPISENVDLTTYLVIQKALEKKPHIINLDLEYEDLLKVAQGLDIEEQEFDKIDVPPEISTSHYTFVSKEITTEFNAFTIEKEYAENNGCLLYTSDAADD